MSQLALYIMHAYEEVSQCGPFDISDNEIPLTSKRGRNDLKFVKAESG